MIVSVCILQDELSELLCHLVEIFKHADSGIPTELQVCITAAEDKQLETCVRTFLEGDFCQSGSRALATYINMIGAQTIDMRVLHKPSLRDGTLTLTQKVENGQLILASAASIGICTSSVSAAQLAVPAKNADALLLFLRRLTAARLLMVSTENADHDDGDCSAIISSTRLSVPLAAASSTNTAAAHSTSAEFESRAERSMRMWINSLGLMLPDGKVVVLDNLLGGCSDGVVLLALVLFIRDAFPSDHGINAMKDADLGMWKTIRTRPINKFERVSNCSAAIEAARLHLGLQLQGLSGADVEVGSQKFVLALMWQLMRRHTLAHVSAARIFVAVTGDGCVESGSARADPTESANDAFFVQWANHCVARAGKTTRLVNLRGADCEMHCDELYLLVERSH